MQSLIVILLFVIALAIAPGLMAVVAVGAASYFTIISFVFLLAIPLALIVWFVSFLRKSGDAGFFAQNKRNRADYTQAVETLRNGNARSALATFQRLASAGYPDAQYQLALMHHQGSGTPKDDTEAARLLLPLAGNGHPEALLILAEIHIVNVELRDMHKAYDLLLKAAANSKLPEDCSSRAKMLIQKIKAILPNEYTSEVGADQDWLKSTFNSLMRSISEGACMEFTSETAVVQVIPLELGLRCEVGSTGLDHEQLSELHSLGFAPDMALKALYPKMDLRYFREILSRSEPDMFATAELVRHTLQNVFNVTDLRTVSTQVF